MSLWRHAGRTLQHHRPCSARGVYRMPVCRFSTDLENQTMWSRMKGAMSNKMNTRTEGKQKEMFGAMMDAMLSVKRYRIKEFLEFNKLSYEKSGADGWKSKMPWAQNDAEGAAELKKMIRVFSALTPEEQLKNKLPAADARRLADRLDVDYEEMRVMLYKLEMSQGMHKWLQTRQARGASLPTCQEDLGMMMHEHPPKLNKRERDKQAWKSLKKQYA